jgi:hemoglobin
LYEQLGGEPAIAAVVDDFYARVLGDASLSPLFVGVDLERLRTHQKRFVGYALGGPNRYTGRSMGRAHAGLGITPEQFGAVAGHLSDALAACGVPPWTVDEVIGHVAQLAPDVIGQ